jgi:hypothetical protein
MLKLHILKHQKKNKNLKKVATTCKRFWHAAIFKLQCAMDLIHNLLKLVIISKSIYRRVKLCITKKKIVTIDNGEHNNESITLGCPIINTKGGMDSWQYLGCFVNIEGRAQLWRCGQVQWWGRWWVKGLETTPTIVH